LPIIVFVPTTIDEEPMHVAPAGVSACSVNNVRRGEALGLILAPLFCFLSTDVHSAFYREKLGLMA